MRTANHANHANGPKDIRPFASFLSVAVASRASGRAFVTRTPATFTHDPDGNLTQDGRWDYTWDAENRVVKMESRSGAPTGSKRRLEFAYDGKARRIWKKVTNLDTSTVLSEEKYVYDGWNLIAILDHQSSILYSFTWGLDLSGTLQGAGGVGGLLSVSNASSGLHFCGYDGNGNVAVLAKGTDGSVTANYEYGPFGETLRVTGTMAKANPFRFSTKFLDDESDFLYYGYRSYNPSTGRWLNRDPLNELGGVNLYGFVHNNPVDLVDTDGQQIYPPYIPPPKPQPLPPPASGKCRIEVCCKPVAIFGSAHCVIRFTGSDGSVTGCRGGPTGTGNSSGAGGSSGSSGSGAGNRQSAHCKGCCGKWGNIVAGCGKGAQGSSDPLELGIWSDLDEARKNPGQCSLIEESAAACGVEACVAREMQKITAGCYIYHPSGPNSNTAWYQALKTCGHKFDPPGAQPGRTDDFSKAKTCAQ